MPIDGRILKELREIRDITQEGLAKQSDVGIATIKRIESHDGIYASRKTSEDRIARSLGVEPDFLSGDKFRRVIDIGGDVELRLDRYVSPEKFRRDSEKLLEIIMVRNQLLNRKP